MSKSYAQDYTDGGAAKSSNKKSRKDLLPSYVNGGGKYGSAEEEQAPARFKSMAEQTGTDSPWEKDVAYDSGAEQVPSELPNAHLGEKEGEIQPPGWQPYSFLRQKIEEFLNNPKIEQFAQINRRIHFEQTDIPSIRIAEAKAAFVKPDIIFGTEMEKSQTKMIIKFAKPSPDTTLEGLERILQTLFNWDKGREKEPENSSTFNTKREKGMGNNAPPVDPLNYQQHLYVFGAFDRPGEVVVAFS